MYRLDCSQEERKTFKIIPCMTYSVSLLMWFLLIKCAKIVPKNYKKTIPRTLLIVDCPLLIPWSVSAESATSKERHSMLMFHFLKVSSRLNLQVSPLWCWDHCEATLVPCWIHWCQAQSFSRQHFGSLFHACIFQWIKTLYPNTFLYVWKDEIWPD